MSTFNFSITPDYKKVYKAINVTLRRTLGNAFILFIEAGIV